MSTKLDSQNGSEKKRRRIKTAEKKHWTIWAFFILATAVIVFRVFDVIIGVLA